MVIICQIDMEARAARCTVHSLCVHNMSYIGIEELPGRVEELPGRVEELPGRVDC